MSISINSLSEKSKKQPVSAKKSKSAYPISICESPGTKPDEEVDVMFLLWTLETKGTAKHLCACYSKVGTV